MADQSEKQDTPKLPPKLNLRKQGILKQDSPADAEPAMPAMESPVEKAAEAASKPASVSAAPSSRSTSRLVVKPLASQPTAASAISEEEASPEALDVAEAAAPAIEIKPLATPPESLPEDEPSKEAPSPISLDAKRKTSRIPLAAAQTTEPVSDMENGATKPKTIKIKPAAPIPRIRSTQPLNITIPIAAESGDQAASDAEKRKTSRIPLDEALTADKESEEPAETLDPTRPKTIKIKRPGSETTPVGAPAQAPTNAANADLGKTARLDHLTLDEMGSTPTHKKTIRVKRPDASTEPTPPPSARLTPPEPIEQPTSDDPGALWAVLGVAAALVLCVVIYMFAAQAMGPNISGTQLSAWTGGPDLTWPGKIMK